MPRHTFIYPLLFAALAALLPAAASATQVPVEVATGPAVFNLDRPQLGGNPNAIAADQPWHFGWRLEIAAKIDSEWAEEHPHLIPEQHRGRLKGDSVVRVSPAELSAIPRSLYISPKVWNTGMYGATWELFHAGVGLRLGEVQLGVGGGLIFTYFFMHSDTLDNFHFVRPGLDLEVKAYIPFADDAGMSLGWSSHVYIPQAIGGGVFDFGGSDTTTPLWHIGETFVMFHYVFDMNLRL